MFMFSTKRRCIVCLMILHLFVYQANEYCSAFDILINKSYIKKNKAICVFLLLSREARWKKDPDSDSIII